MAGAWVCLSKKVILRGSLSETMPLTSKEKLLRQLVISCCITLSLFYLIYSHSPQPRGSGILQGEWLEDIANSTLGFEKIYAVNMPSRTDRRDALVLMSKLTGIQLEWIDGIDGKAVPDNALPYPALHDTMNAANIGSWRGHMNALQMIVDKNISSALILEDDVDWDIRIKRQLQEYALTTRALLQPLWYYLPTPPSYVDTSLLSPNEFQGMPDDIDFDRLPRTVTPTETPYGDGWDVLWLGHCGAEFPNTDIEAIGARSQKLPRGRVVHKNDETVPENEYLHFRSEADDPRKTYPPHTRVTHHVLDTICSLGYAVSQQGARQLLYKMGVARFDREYDVMLLDHCQGGNGGKCLTMQPQLFNHHRPAGYINFHSDISNHAGVNVTENVVEEASTEMIRWSTRMNLWNLIKGKSDHDDEWPDHDA